MALLNPCCVPWEKKWKKMAEGRAHLRKALPILQDKIASLENEKLDLHKVCEEQRNRADGLEEENKKEASLRSSLEDELTALKLEKCLMTPDADCKTEELEKEILLLEECISEKNEEIERLKQLLAEEKSLTGTKKKFSSREKKNVAELQKNLQSEKSRADEACKIADAAKQKSEDDRLLVETLNNEMKNISLKLEEVNRLLEAEKQRLDVEKKKVDEERVSASELRRIAEANEKKAADEKSHAIYLSRMLEEEKQKVEKLQRELQEATSCEKSAVSSQLDNLRKTLEAEKHRVVVEEKKADEERERANELRRIAEVSEKKFADEMSHATNLSRLLDLEKQKVEKLQKELQEALSCENSTISSQLDDLSKSLEAEKHKVVVEKNKADEERAKANELQRLAVENARKVADEKSHAINLSRMLEVEKQKVEQLLKELQEALSCEKSAFSSQLDDLRRNLDAEREKVVLGNQRADLEKSEKEENKKAAEANMRKAMEEKHCADKLSHDLQTSRQRINNLEQELTKANCILEAERLASAKQKYHADELITKLKEQEKSAIEADKVQLDKLREKLEAEKKVAIEKRRADFEMSVKEEHKKVAEVNIKKAMEEKLRADKLSQDLQYNRQRIESLEAELNKVNCMLEAERSVLAKERNHADALKSKLEEQTRIIIEDEKKGTEGQCQSGIVIKELENVRQKLKDMENQLSDVKQFKVLAGAANVTAELFLNKELVKVNFLQDQLNFEKKRTKHYKEVAKIEKDRNSDLQQELQKVQQDSVCVLQQMVLLSDTFCARYNMNKKRCLNMPSLELPGKMPSSSPPQHDFCGDADLRLSSLSSRDTSCHLKPNTRLVDAGQPVESPSGMKIDLDPLLGGSHGDILASSALNFNAASFSDEQLLGSQERAADSLTNPTEIAVKDPDLLPTTVRCNGGEKDATVAENSINPVELEAVHVKKRRKIIDEGESIRCMDSLAEKIILEAETNPFGSRDVFVQPMTKQKKVNVPVTSNNAIPCGNVDLSGNKSKSTHGAQVVLQQVDDSTMQMEMEKLNFHSPTITDRRENSQPEKAVQNDLTVSVHDTLLCFEQELNGDYMKLLDLDDAVAEEHFRKAFEHPLSPLPDIYLNGFDEDVELQILGTPVCSTSNDTEPTGEYNKIPNFCVVFSDMGDIDCISRISCATRTHTALLQSRLQTHWLVEDVLWALVTEEDLISREKACVFFSLMLLNFVCASCGKSIGFQSQQLITFSTHLQSVLLNVETRHLFAKVCGIGNLLGLSEDFLVNKKIMLRTGVSSDQCEDSEVEILHQCENNVLRSNVASTNMVVAGSVILASVSVAAGIVDSLCEFSLKIIKMISTDCSITLLILHAFAYVCGEEYFRGSNYYSVMEAVKFRVASAECSLAMNGNIHPGDGTWHQFFPCDRCPFGGSSTCIDDVSSKLLEELQRWINSRHEADTFDLHFLVTILSSLELLAANMGWEWVCDKVIPKLLRVLDLCDPGTVVLIAVVPFVACFGRIGVETVGYNDPVVKSIIRQLSANLQRTIAMKCHSLSLLIVHAITQLQPNGHDVSLKNAGNWTLKGALSDSGTDASDIMMTLFSF